MTSASAHFTTAERYTLYNVLHARRDMQHFLPDSHIDEQVLDRLLQAAHSAPSVGLMQPWRFIRICATAIRKQISALVENERLATANVLGERDAEFIAAVLAPDDGTVFGHRPMLEQLDWRHGKSLSPVLMENGWQGELS